MEKRANKVGIRLTDDHMNKLNEYCSMTGANPTGVINTLAESYIQAMIDRNKFISPNVTNFSVKELLMVAEDPHPYAVKKEKKRAG